MAMTVIIVAVAGVIGLLIAGLVWCIWQDMSDDLRRRRGGREE